MLKNIAYSFTLFVLTLFLFMSVSSASETELTIQTQQLQIGEHSIAYPYLQHHPNPSIEKTINDAIILQSAITEHMVAISSNPPVKLTVSHSSTIYQTYFSTVITTQNGNEISAIALTFDINTGKQLTLADYIGTDKKLPILLQNTLKNAMQFHNEYLATDALLPMPTTSFTVDQYGITLYYTNSAFQFSYAEMGKVDELTLQTVTQNGFFPSLPITLGMPMDEILHTYTLQRTPDQFPMGAYYALRYTPFTPNVDIRLSPLFRSVYLISDTLQATDGLSVVEGIQIRRGGVGEYQIGKSLRSQWISSLSTPTDSVQINENLAYDYQVPIGVMDLYTYGDYQLRLFSDTDEKLFAIQINQLP